jgi:hypothetical protein
VTDTDEGATWVSLREASERAHVSVSWLRKQYREHGLPTIETVGPRGAQKAVPLEEVVARAAAFTAPGAAHSFPAVDGPGPVEAAMVGLLDRLADAERRAAKAEAEAAYLMLKLDDAYREIDQLRRRVAVLVDAT